MLTYADVCRQVRRLIDGNNGTTVTLTNWSRQRGVIYSVTLTRAHLPCVTSSGNGADMYATDLIARMHDMMEDMRLLATALCDEKRASEQQRLKAHAKHEEVKVLKVLTNYLLASAEDGAAVAHSIHASIANDLEVQTKTLLACKREVCETRDHNTLLQDQLGAMHGQIQKESTYNQQLRSRVHDLDERLQHALMHSQRLALQIKSSVRNRSHLMWQRRLQRILAGTKESNFSTNFRLSGPEARAHSQCGAVSHIWRDILRSRQCMRWCWTDSETRLTRAAHFCKAPNSTPPSRATQDISCRAPTAHVAQKALN